MNLRRRYSISKALAHMLVPHASRRELFVLERLLAGRGDEDDVRTAAAICERTDHDDDAARLLSFLLDDDHELGRARSVADTTPAPGAATSPGEAPAPGSVPQGELDEAYRLRGAAVDEAGRAAHQVGAIAAALARVLGVPLMTPVPELLEAAGRAPRNLPARVEQLEGELRALQRAAVAAELGTTI